MSLKKNFGRGVAALTLTGAALTALPATAADHRDGAASLADPTSDINDLYTWMNEDNLVLAMTVNPFADAEAVFSPEVQFVWSVDAWPSFGASIGGLDPSLQTQVHCEFDDAQMVQCWVHRGGEVLDYLMGDPALEDGILSESGNVRVFAGLRADPFYFYLTGFNAARGAVITEVEEGRVNNPPTTSTLCPELSPAQLDALGDALVASGPGAQSLNDFDDANTLIIVAEINKAHFTDAEADVVSVRASTHAK